MKKFCVSFFVLFLISCSQDSVQSEVTVKKFNWSMVTTWPKNYPGLGMAPERFSKMVNEMSQGQLKITVYGAGEFVPAMGVFDAVSSGSVEMGHGGAYYWKGKVLLHSSLQGFHLDSRLMKLMHGFIEAAV